MCKHQYVKLGRLMVYEGDSFCPWSVDSKYLKGTYSGSMTVAESIFVFLCINCGDVKLSTTEGVFKKICQTPE